MKKRIIWPVAILILGGAFLSFFFFPCATRPKKEGPFIVRVRIRHNVDELTFVSSEGCKVQDGGVEEILPAGLKINLNKDTFASGGLKVFPLDDGFLSLNGRTYRGEIDIVKKESGFDVINRVELEDYLKGVIPREMNHLWPSSALRAQAIASRSFAVHEALRRKGKEYDLTADSFSQVYGGKTSEKWRTTRAVEATRGKVLEYKGKIFPAYFHSCCGGHTENAARLWNEGLAPLKGTRCSWCRWSPHFRWMTRISTKEILKKLKGKGYDIKRIDSIKTGKRDASGRVEYVSLKSGNRWLEIKTNDFCSAVGRKSLRSSKFRIKKYPFFYLFSGHGWGHGVGMCQWGAFGLALRWWNYKKILAYYYPGTKIVNLGKVLK